METLKTLIEERSDAALKEFFDFLRIQSVSTEKEHEKDMVICMEWLKIQLENMGFSTKVWPTDKHPALFASHCHAGDDKPTLLIYNHYDVQPVDPLEEWCHPPFEPHLHEGEVYARGAVDNKGQCFYCLEGIRNLLKRDGKLPINIKFLIEGEEEIGSPSLPVLLKKKQQDLAADYLAIVDVGIPAKDRPAVTLGTRGMIYMTLTAKGSSGDLHSGEHGGIVFNPLHALVQVLGKMRDESGCITIPGFYDAVKELTEEEKQRFSFDFDEEKYIEEIGSPATGGETAYSPVERGSIRPTFEINGINGGYGGPGSKTVIPAQAIAKVSCRLVPDQVPEVIAEQVTQEIKRLCPKGISIDVKLHEGLGAPARSNVDTPVVEAFVKAYEEVFEKPCEYILCGGSIPIAPQLQEACGGDLILVGLCLNDNIHAPNEHFGVDRLKKGALIIARAIEHLGKN
jgi:acetylornithine deacetylase/succinyl-diaminopimelate desuccinylase-like protein